MRFSIVFRGAALGLLCVAPILAQQIQFQQPTEAELKMTSDPMAPGAAAVYLDIVQNANDPLHTQSYYARIKVLTDKGKELATVQLPYLQGGETIDNIRGRTIHPDGTVIPLTVKPEDLLIAKSGNEQIERKVFTLPSVEVGSILEYSYDLGYGENYYSSPRWEIQRPYLVHKAHYEFTPYAAFTPGYVPGERGMTGSYLEDAKGHLLDNLLWEVRLPPGVILDRAPATGRFTVDVTNVPPIPDEEWMPPISSLLYKVQFYYSYAGEGSQFWVDTGKQWAKDVSRFADPSKAIQAAVDGIVAPGDSDQVKAQKLYAAVQALNNTDYTRQKSASELKQLKIKAAKRAQDTWAQKSGSSNDIAMLYLAMARAAGLQAYAVEVEDRDQGIFDPTYLDADQFDDMLVILNIGGKQTLLDPGEKTCPFGMVRWNHSDTVGLRESSQGLGFTNTPPQDYTQNTTLRTGDITLDDHGGVSGVFYITMTGQEAIRWRQLALENDISEVKKKFDNEFQAMVPAGVEAHVDHFLAFDDPNSNLVAVVDAKGSIGTAAGKAFILPAFFFETRTQEPFVNEAKRLEQVDMHYGDEVIDKIAYHLPAGVTVEGAPQDGTNVWPGQAAYAVKIEKAPGQITITRQLVRGFTLVKPEDYQQLHGFYAKVAAADQQEIVLDAAPAVKGN